MKLSSIFTSTFLVCLFNLFFSGLFGQGITAEQAKLVARNFYYQQNNEIASKAAVQVSGVSEQKMQNETMFYLCQMNETGFVIVANDMRVPAILGYSTENGEINDINPEFAAYLNRYKKQLAYLKAHNFSTPNPEVSAQWQMLSDVNFEKSPSANKTTAAVTPLLTCAWGQGNPYNSQCPGNASGKAVTGCVATAMSQVMHYHKHPQMGNGSQTESNDFGTYTVNYESAIYDWANMPNTIAAGSTNTQIPKLCYHAGISVDMDYGLSSSGANSSDAATAFGTRFGYNNGGMIDESSYTYANWKLYLKNKLDSNLPLYMRGSGPDGGHAWVCDGYDASDYFHMNWGWYGGSNGYFSVGDLSPGSYTFDDGNQVIVNTPIRPNLTGTFSSSMSAAVNQNATLAIQFSVLNLGGWKAKSSAVKYYFSTNNTWDAGDTYLTTVSVSAINELVFSGSATVNANVVLPGATSGYLLAKVDANTEVTETNESDNVIAKYITIRYLNVASSLTFYGNFNSTSVPVSAQSSVNWTATSNQTWCGTNFNTGTGNGNFYLNIAANPNTTARTATVTVTGSGITKYITVTQKAAPSISVSPTTINRNHSAGTYNISVSSTVPYSVADNATWITPSVTSGIDGSTSFSLALTTNYGTTDRTGTVTVSGYGISKTITVTQKAFNDNPCYATSLNVYSSALYASTLASNEGASTTTTIPATACASTMMNDVWFKFTAPTSGAFTVQTSTSALVGGYLSDVVMFVYQATNCSTMTMIDCIDTYYGNAMPKSVKTGVTAGSQIYVRIGTKTNISGLFNIVVFNSAVPVTTPNNENDDNDPTARFANDISSELEMQVFPNPASEQFTIKMNYPVSENVRVSVMDLTGKECFSQSLNWEAGENSLEVPIQNLSSGLYMVTLKGSQILKTAKIYKQ